VAKQICVVLSLTAKEKALVGELAKRLSCSRTELVLLALRQFLAQRQSQERRP